MVSMDESSDWLIAVIGLVGVVVGALLTAGTSIYTMRRREDRDARAARRVVESELKEAARAVKDMLEFKEWPPGWTNTTWSESWSMYRPALALAIRDDDQFQKIATAYLDMRLLQTGLAAGKRGFVTDDPTFLTHASQTIGDALALVSAPRDDSP
jgi:hypothetical protein